VKIDSKGIGQRILALPIPARTMPHAFGQVWNSISRGSPMGCHEDDSLT